MRRSVAKLQASLPSGEVADVVAYLKDHLATSAGAASRQADAPGAKSVTLWMNATCANSVLRWTELNNSTSLTSHATYLRVLQEVLKKLGLRDCDIEDEHAVSVTLADCVWTIAQVIYDQVPTGVPTLAVAVVLKFAETPSGAEVSLPDYCNFLCSKVTEEERDVYWQQVSFHAVLPSVALPR